MMAMRRCRLLLVRALPVNHQFFREAAHIIIMSGLKKPLGHRGGIWQMVA